MVDRTEGFRIVDKKNPQFLFLSYEVLLNIFLKAKMTSAVPLPVMKSYCFSEISGCTKLPFVVLKFPKSSLKALLSGAELSRGITSSKGCWLAAPSHRFEPSLACGRPCGKTRRQTTSQRQRLRL